MRVRTAFPVASFVIAYFLGLTYAMLRAGTYFGLEEYSVLVLVAVVFGILAIRHKTRFGTGFLIFFNTSRIFFLGFGVGYLLNGLGLVRLPLNNVDFFGLWLSFGVYVTLNFVYTLGFRDRKQKHIIFSWVKDARQVRGAN